MKAAVLESRPLIGLGIQQVLHRIADVHDASVVSPALSPSPSRAHSLRGIELLIVGDLFQGYDAATLELLGTADAVRGVLYLGSSGTVQWTPPRTVSPLLSWLPENAPADDIEQTMRRIIGAMRTGGTEPGREAAPSDDGVAVVLPMVPARNVGQGLPAFAAEAQLLNLTQRQYDVLVLLSKGMSIKLISRRLDISVPTVKSHTLQIYRRLAARSKTEAVFRAREKGAMLSVPSAAVTAEAA
ncbi:response regulator transcription factor [Cupriavidus pauculus]|uniref:DNA-binding response regulator n=1 Tax=Cupriavidus pauculus TaxID=82633 RepID=A0A3G8H5X1_9BURK|nr:LuxR C-terminal-related transcriptional regulator [Cupriavidus pauculus]AZG15953.1 DNA-binding response regulator [Cupriavidus pauculus]